LVNNPQFLKEILEEQEQLYKSNEKSYYSTEQIARMEKLDSFIKETLRVNVNNVALQHKTLSSYFTFSNGYQVPKGRLVNICSGEIHSDKELQGKHTCPGRHFAVNEIKLTLHYLLLKYDIKKASIEKIKPKIYGALKFPKYYGKQSLEDCILALFMMEIQVIRRAFECFFIEKPSLNSKMLITHHIIGITYYIATGLAVIIEGLWNLGVFNKGDWFDYISSAHYFAEILIYFSFVILTKGMNLTIWLILIWTIIGLGIMARENEFWGRERFGEKWPKRWIIIPFF
ncbi:1444_t:CDS:2, partial [Rhizophagus irregularis]